MEVQNQLQARERWQSVRIEQEETTPQWLRWCLYSNQSVNCQVIISGYGCFLTSFVKWRWFSRSSLVQKVNRDDFCATLSVPLSCTFIGPGSCDTRPGPFQEGDGRVCWLPSRPLGIKDGWPSDHPQWSFTRVAALPLACLFARPMPKRKSNKFI